MKKIIGILLLCVSVSYGASWSLVPNADNDGSVGTTGKQWATGYFKTFFVNNIAFTNGSPGVAGTNGTFFSLNGLTGVVVLGISGSLGLYTNGQTLVISNSYSDTPWLVNHDLGGYAATNAGLITWNACWGSTNVWTGPPLMINGTGFTWYATYTNGTLVRTNLDAMW